MATREENIQKIRTAVYGKDVREAIAEGMEQTYDACEDFADSASASAAAAAAALPIDTTLSVAGKAADAKATGDAVDELKSAIDYGSITVGVKNALIACFDHVVWDDDDPTGQTYIDALYDALYNRYWQVTNTLNHCTSSNGAEQTIKGNPYTATITASAGYTLTGATVSVTMGGTNITSTAYSNGVISIPAVTGALVISVSAVALPVSSISALFTQGDNEVYLNTPLNDLKPFLVVTATYADSSTAVLDDSDYTLSGTLTSGSSTVTITASSKTTTFIVTVIGEYWIDLDFTNPVRVDGNTYYSYDAEIGSLRVYGTKNGTYSGVDYGTIPIDNGYTYKLSCHIHYVSGVGRAGFRLAENPYTLAKSGGSQTQDGDYIAEAILSDLPTFSGKTVCCVTFFRVWDESTMGDVTYSNIKLTKYIAEA